MNKEDRTASTTSDQAYTASRQVTAKRGPLMVDGVQFLPDTWANQVWWPGTNNTLPEVVAIKEDVPKTPEQFGAETASEIGRIINTRDPNPGQQYLLCNGDQFYETNYPELAPLCDTTYTKWVMTASIQDAIKGAYTGITGTLYIYKIFVIDDLLYIYTNTSNANRLNETNAKLIKYNLQNRQYSFHSLVNPPDGYIGSTNGDAMGLWEFQGSIVAYYNSTPDYKVTLKYSLDGFTFTDINTIAFNQYYDWIGLCATSTHLVILGTYRMSGNFILRAVFGTSIQDLVQSSYKTMAYMDEESHAKFYKVSEDHILLYRDGYSYGMDWIICIDPDKTARYFKPREIPFQGDSSRKYKEIKMTFLNGNIFLWGQRDTSSLVNGTQTSIDGVTWLPWAPTEPDYNTLSGILSSMFYFPPLACSVYLGGALRALFLPSVADTTDLTPEVIYGEVNQSGKPFIYKNKLYYLTTSGQPLNNLGNLGEILSNPITSISSPVVPDINIPGCFSFIKAKGNDATVLEVLNE